MSVKNVTAWMCPLQVNGIQYFDQPPECGGNTEIDGAVTVGLLPEKYGINPSYVAAGIVKTLEIPRWCMGQREGALHWEVDWTWQSNFVDVHFSNPLICNWTMTEVYTQHHGLLTMAFPDSGDGLCPENKEDALRIIERMEKDTRELIPGEMLYLKWKYDGPVAVQVANTYFYTCCMTGGTVISVIGEYGKDDIKYSVEIEGAEYECESSDFFEYKVGDWVQVLKPNGSGCSDWQRNDQCEGNEFKGGKALIFPLNVDGKGPTG